MRIYPRDLCNLDKLLKPRGSNEGCNEASAGEEGRPEPGILAVAYPGQASPYG